jgi:nicotinamide-nucleotide amidase
MVLGTLEHSRAELAVSVTGIAGPGGGSADKPVGLVYIGLCRRGAAPTARRHDFPGGRSEVRRATLEAALAGLSALALRSTAGQ